MKRLYSACVWFLIAFGIVIGLLSIGAEIERREAAELQAMMKKHRAAELARIYGDLDAKGRMMTGYDLIGKK